MGLTALAAACWANGRRERTRPLVLHHFQTGRGARPRGPPCSPPPHLRARRQARRVPRTIPRVHFFFSPLGGVAKRRKIHRGTSWSQSSKAYAILAVVRCAFQNFVLGLIQYQGSEKPGLGLRIQLAQQTWSRPVGRTPRTPHTACPHLPCTTHARRSYSGDCCSKRGCDSLINIACCGRPPVVTPSPGPLPCVESPECPLDDMNT